MRSFPASLAALTVCLLSCADEPVVPAELAEVCGGDGPVRVLELGPDDVVRAGESISVGDRVVRVVSRLDRDEPTQPYSMTAASAVWATGPCGESPVRLAEGVEDIFTIEAWPGVVLGCEKATGDVLVLDPTGARAPQVVFAATHVEWSGCGFGWTDAGLLDLEPQDDEFSALRLYPTPADPLAGAAPPVVLLESVRTAPNTGGGLGVRLGVLHTFPDEVLALTPDGSLIRLDPHDGATTVLYPSTAAFVASRDGRWLLRQDATVTGGEPDRPEGPVSLHDRVEGGSVSLGETALAYGASLTFADRGVFDLRLDAGPTRRLYTLPDLEFFDVPWDLFLNGRLADGRWLAQYVFTADKRVFVDIAARTVTDAFPRAADLVHVTDDAVYLVARSGSSSRTDGPLYRVPLDDGDPVRVARRATRQMALLSDGRFVGPVGMGSDWLGALVILDPDTGDELRIDDAVHGHTVDTTRLHSDGILGYSVVDGDRTGYYLAKLPP